MNVNKLRSLGACIRAIAWAHGYPDAATPQQLWDSCPDGTWMLWLLCRTAKTTTRRVAIVLFLCTLAKELKSEDIARILSGNTLEHYFDTHAANSGWWAVGCPDISSADVRAAFPKPPRMPK